MTLSRRTTLFTLLEEYPCLESFLVGKHRAFARLQRPALRRRWSRMVTLGDLATEMDRPWSQLLHEIQTEVRRVSGVTPTIADDVAEFVGGPHLRRDLRAILAELEQGAPLRALSERIDQLTHGLDEQAVTGLVRELERVDGASSDDLVGGSGRPPDWRVGRLSLYPGHPVRSLQQENARLADLLGHVEAAVAGLGDQPDERRWRAARPVVAALLGRLAELERQARRFRLAWYATLVSRGGRSLTAFLDGEVDEAIAAVEALRGAEKRDDPAFVCGNLARAASLVRRVLGTEERLLVPATLGTLDDDDWEAVAEQERVVGWALSPG